MRDSDKCNLAKMYFVVGCSMYRYSNDVAHLDFVSVSAFSRTGMAGHTCAKPKDVSIDSGRIGNCARVGVSGKHILWWYNVSDGNGTGKWVLVAIPGDNGRQLTERRKRYGVPWRHGYYRQRRRQKQSVYP
jgi:hypothetical protein